MATQEHRSTHNKIVSVQVSSIVTLEALSLQELPPDHSRVALALLIHRDGVVSEIKADDEAAIGILGELAVKRSNVSEECALQPGILRQMAAYNGTRGLWQQRHAILSGIFLRAKAIVWGQLGGDGLAIAIFDFDGSEVCDIVLEGIVLLRERVAVAQHHATAKDLRVSGHRGKGISDEG